MSKVIQDLIDVEFSTEKTTRYALDIDMYVYAKNDKEAKDFAEKLTSFLRKELDNGARAKKLVEIPFGTLDARTVKL